MWLKFLFCLSFLFLPLDVLAVGLAVEPASLEIVYPQDQESQLKISNISGEPIFVKVQADDLSANLDIQPQEFNLLPEETMIVELGFDFTQGSSLVQKTNLSILSQALHPNSSNAISGIKIPLTITMTESSGVNKWLILLSAFVVFVLILWLILKIFVWFSLRKRKKFLDLDFLLHHKWWLLKTGRWHKLWRK